jgi:LysR family nitrogen assimilation transcriptional regulator
MEQRQLKYFVAIADAGSFTSAALNLHIAQSALSRHMRRLEESVGGELFERGARGVVLTASGAALLIEARLILARFEDARSSILALHGEVRGHVKLAMPSSLSHLIYVPMVTHFLEQHPGVMLELSEGTSQNVLGRLRDATIDVGIVSQHPSDRHLDYIPLMDEDLMLIGSATSPLMRKRLIAPELLHQLPLVMASGLLPLLGPWAADLKPIAMVDSTAPVKALVLSGRVFGVVPSSSAAGDIRAEGLAAVKIKGLRLTRMLATHRGRPVSGASRVVIRYLKEQARHLAASGTAIPLSAAKSSRSATSSKR